MVVGRERLRCPLSVRGLNSPLVASCVGFDPLALTAPGSGPGAQISGVTCTHLQLSETARGFAPTCSHVRSAAVVQSARLVAATPRVDWPALAGLSVAAIVTDVAGAVAFWNPVAERLYGWRADDAVGTSILELTVDPESIGRAAAIMEEVAGGFAWEGSWGCRMRDGGVLLVRLLDVPLCAADGQPVGIAGFSVPISDSVPDLGAIARSLGLDPRFRPHVEPHARPPLRASGE
ncbi:MAG: hypothetical protein NVSMB29_00580 [Candidatus Dormibacteria bacterium]